MRAGVLLDAAAGVANTVIADRHGVTAVTVRAWRKAFEVDGLANWGKVAPGRGRKPTISEEKVAEILKLTTKTTPEGMTHWSCREMAKRVGVSKDTVQRIWSGRTRPPPLDLHRPRFERPRRTDSAWPPPMGQQTQADRPLTWTVAALVAVNLVITCVLLYFATAGVEDPNGRPRGGDPSSHGWACRRR